MNQAISGPRSAPHLMLLAGLLCDETIWEPVAQQLSPVSQPQIVSFPRFRSMEAMADHVLANAPACFALAGHSMGGRVALEVYRRAPHRVSRLALLNTGVHPPGVEEPESRGRLVALAREHGMAALAQQWLPPMLSPAAQSDGGLMQKLREMVERNSPESFGNQIEALLTRPDARSLLSQIKVETLFLSGSEDRWSPPGQHAAMHEMIAGSELVIIEGAGHMSLLEDPVSVCAALQDWLRRPASPPD